MTPEDIAAIIVRYRLTSSAVACSLVFRVADPEAEAIRWRAILDGIEGMPNGR